MPALTALAGVDGKKRQSTVFVLGVGLHLSKPLSHLQTLVLRGIASTALLKDGHRFVLSIQKQMFPPNWETILRSPQLLQLLPKRTKVIALTSRGTSQAVWR